MKYLLIIFTAVSLFAQQNESVELKKLQKKFEEVNSIVSDFKQYTGGKQNISGKFFYQKKNKTRLEIKNIFIISDGETTYNYNKKENKVIISNYNESDPNVLSIEKFIYDYPSKCSNVDQVTEGRNTIVMIPKDNSLNFKKAVIVLNSDSMISKVVLIAKNGQSIEFVLSNLKLNPQIDADKFSFSPPENSKVIDLR
ncbi:MAG: outer membrane lipoprotein carrier protein LolA [Ignavibacteriales bacterium]|jgi:chaperone LolA|nr:outer-membrane lipoprotein carrier protein LolA [Ignavibacteriaceae bacterium]NLH61359.1 outer membrane lipoprotein carrier protein LolA [Ignavibacteriales bacterium]HOJ18602.1 outer-membrane lipoprotein carrier protein LolA [Ignavibacteriaceae bacterium]